MFYSYTYPSFLARYLFFFLFFLNKEITGDKLEEENKIREEERKKKDLSISRKIHFKTNIYKAGLLSKIFPNGCCKINSRNDDGRRERVR